MEVEWSLNEEAHVSHFPGTGELRKELLDILGEVRIGGHIAQVRVAPCGARVIVARSKVHISAQPLSFAPDYEQHLRVGLQAYDPVYDRGSYFLQASGKVDVLCLIESSS